MTTKRPSWKEIIDKRRKDNFVGRGDYLHSFSENLSTDLPLFLLFFVTGEGGVGKSTLLRQFEAVATGPRIEGIVITCDDEQPSPVATMGRISELLANFDIRSKEFDERYKTFRTRKDEIESDPKAPRGALNLVVRGMTDFAIKSARRAPGVGVFAEYVDEKDAGEALAQGVNYIIDRIGNKDEVELLREPERILSPLFIELLRKACETHPIVLMFDVFERTHEALEPWLMKLLNFEYGDLESQITFVISGRDTLDQRWTEIASSICHITLEPFSLEETRLYLSHRYITDDQLVAQIYEDTGGLPVLVELLAGTNPKPGSPLPDISKDAVKRFLQWIPEEDRQQVALLAAVPRSFNLDILSAALDSNAASNFNWLSVQSYIRTSKARGWFYHEKVRELMLRYLRNTRPGDLTAAHSRLAHFFETEQNQLMLYDKAAYNSESWCTLEIERVYHLLCEQPNRNITQVINAFLRAFRWRWRFAENIVLASKQSAHEMASHELQETAQVLATFYQAYDKDKYVEFMIQVNLLAQRNDLDSIAQATLFRHRGRTYFAMGKYPEAIADLDSAITLDEKDDWALARRGASNLQMGKYLEALADFDRAIALDEKNDMFLAIRGTTYGQMGKYPEAVADFDRAIALDEKNYKILVVRGAIYGQMGKYPEAVADFDRAIELDPADAEAYIDLGNLLSDEHFKRYEEAEAAYRKAIELDPADAAAHFNLGLLLQGDYFKRYEEAEAAYRKAIELDPADAAAHFNLGILLQGEYFKRYDEAEAAYRKAIELDPADAATYNNLGNLLRGEHFKRYEEAEAAYRKAFELDPAHAAAHFNLGILLQGEYFKRYEEAEAAYRKGIELDPADVAAHFNLGLLLQGEYFKRYEEAEAAYRKAIELDPADAAAYYNLGNLLSDEHFMRYEEAEAAYRKVIELDPADASAHSILGNLLKNEHFKRYEEAEAAYRKAIELDPADAAAYSNLGNLLSDEHFKHYEEAEAAYRKAIELDPADASAYSNLGNLLKNEHFKRYEEAEAAYRKAIELDPAYAKAYSNLGLLLSNEHFKRYEEADAAYRKAIELDPVAEYSYLGLGQIYFDLGKYDVAIRIFSDAIDTNHEFARCFRMRGLVHQTIGDLEAALADYKMSVKLKPDYGIVRMSLFGLLTKMGRTDEANEHEPFARAFAKNENEYNRACFESICGNTEEALDLLRAAFEKGQSSKTWARQDPDLINLWDEPSFKKLVEE
jgi:tetratricopeptide (TPR) repeat protein